MGSTARPSGRSVCNEPEPGDIADAVGRLWEATPDGGTLTIRWPRLELADWLRRTDCWGEATDNAGGRSRVEPGINAGTPALQRRGWTFGTQPAGSDPEGHEAAR